MNEDFISQTSISGLSRGIGIRGQGNGIKGICIGWPIGLEEIDFREIGIKLIGIR